MREHLLVCGKLIRDPNFGALLWAQYRGELLRRADVKTFWAFSQFEKPEPSSGCIHPGSGLPKGGLMGGSEPLGEFPCRGAWPTFRRTNNRA